MGFVQSSFLAALAALAIPLVIHLVFRQRARPVDLGTLRFLRVVLQQNARRRRVKRWLLLSLRMACLALLALLFARPFLVARERGSQDRFVAVLIDRSASMWADDGNGRLIDQALEDARTLVRQIPNGAFEVGFFDDQIHPVRSEDAGRSIVEALQAPDDAYGATNYGRALAWARDVCLRAPQPRREVHLWTDLQRSGLDWSEFEPLPDDIDVHLHELGRTVTVNLAVTGARVLKSLVRPGDTVLIDAGVFNDSPFPVKKLPVQLRLAFDNRTIHRTEYLDLEPTATGTVQFELADLPEGLWQGQVLIESDDQFAFDNQRQLAIDVAPPLEVVVVDGDPRETPWRSETWFLEAAIGLAPRGERNLDSPYVCRHVPVGEAAFSPPPLDRTTIVVLANVPRLSSATADALGRYVADGGGLLVFTGENVSADAARTLETAGLAVGTIQGAELAGDLPWRLESWDVQHSIFRPFSDPQHGDLRLLAFRGCTRIEPHDDAVVVARFRGGVPAVIERRHGRGRVVWVTTACDRDWGDWPRSKLYVPLVHQLAGHLSGLNDGGAVREALVGTGDETMAVPGIYQRDGYWSVVNPNPRESEIGRCSTEDFAERFRLRLDANDGGARARRSKPDAAGFELRDDEIWHWVLLALLGVLLVENFAANRTTA